MKISIYDVSVPEFIAGLNALSHVIDKAAAIAEEKKFDMKNLIHARLAPDMFDFSTQVRIACKNACDFVSQATGLPMPALEKKEDETVEELQARITTALEYLKNIEPQQLEGAEDKKMTFYFAPAKYSLGHEFFTEYLQPNFFFHVVTAYAILRTNGVPIGKQDYILNMTMRDLEQ